MTRRAWLAAVAASLLARPAGAHHSFAAEFDAAHPRDFAGAVAQFDWVNPHSVLQVDVPGPGGAVERWSFELPPPSALRRRGLAPDQVKPGERVVVRGYPAKDGRLWASTQWLELPGGRRIITGTPGVSK